MREMVPQNILKDVERGLKEPEKAHLVSERV